MEQFRVLQTFGIKEIVFGTSTLALVSYLLLGAIYNRYFHPLSQFPGPFWGSITNFHQAFKLLRVGSEPAIVADLHRRYGPVVRRAPNSLMWNDAAVCVRARVKIQG